jgi:hypothetical protein
MFKTARPSDLGSRSMGQGLGQICAFYGEVGVGGASGAPWPHVGLESILGLEQIELVLS